ncbi:hypothetical protein GGF32_001673 [Allomyces javanicus]|nr:hypothetical protein GGF32_001673 [Allomyces javanicus]
MAHHTTITLFATLALLILAAGSVDAATVDISLDQWTQFLFPDGITSTPLMRTCVDTIDEALPQPAFSKSYYELPAGAWLMDFKLDLIGDLENYGWLKVKTGPCVDPPFKIVTTVGKARTRAAAVAACQAEGRVLAAVASANWNDVVALVRAKPNLNKSPVFDAVVIDLYNGDTYAGIDLELVVSKFGAAVSMLVFSAYLLCAMAPITVG